MSLPPVKRTDDSKNKKSVESPQSSTASSSTTNEKEESDIQALTQVIHKHCNSFLHDNTTKWEIEKVLVKLSDDNLKKGLMDGTQELLIETSIKVKVRPTKLDNDNEGWTCVNIGNPQVGPTDEKFPKRLSCPKFSLVHQILKNLTKNLSADSEIKQAIEQEKKVYIWCPAANNIPFIDVDVILSPYSTHIWEDVPLGWHVHNVVEYAIH